jgi:hypothetical protein
MPPAQLLRNQWFLLFSLLAMVSLGTTVFDIGSGRFAPRPNHGPISSPSKTWNNDLATESTPTSASPAPNLNIPVLKPKTSGKWIVDASGSAEADSRELSAVIANASDGDTIMLRPGEYKGEVTISKSVHVIGVTDQNGAGGALPVIHGRLTDSLTVTGSHVVLENLVVSQDTPGNLRGVFVDQEASLEMVKCTVQARSKFGLDVLKQGKIVVHDSTFETYGAGSGVTIEENGRGTLERCAVANNAWGAVCSGSAKLELKGCIFRQNGTADGAGCTVEAYGGHAQVQASGCQFQENAATAWANESGTLNITDSTFEGNGLTGDAKFAGRGLVCAVNSGTATISNCAFDRNKQGVVATNGGKMQIVGCKFDANGLITQNQSLLNFTSNVYVFGPSAAMNISNTPFTNVVNGALYSVEGGQLNLENCAIQGGVSGLQVGFENEPASASLQRVEFSGQSSSQVYVCGGSRVTLEKCRMLQGRSGVDGLLVRAGSKVEVAGCEFLEAGSSGLEAADPNTEITVRDSRFAGNQGSGLLVSNQATLAGSDCLVEGNQYGVQAGLPNARNSAGTITLERCTVRSNRYWGVGALARSTIVLRGVSFANQQQNTYRESGAGIRIERF